MVRYLPVVLGLVGAAAAAFAPIDRMVGADVASLEAQQNVARAELGAPLLAETPQTAFVASLPSAR